MRRDSKAALFEFFAGGGMARLGLAPWFDTRFANELDPKKITQYQDAFGGEELLPGDVWAINTSQMPGTAALAWASFPCQDLSLAGLRGGLTAPRSGAFFGFWRLIEALHREGRAPNLLALENVLGLATSNGGRDLAALGEALAGLGYNFGALVLDAADFLPQSRPRLFIVATRGDPGALRAANPDPRLHPDALTRAVTAFGPLARARHVWWRLPPPPPRATSLAALIDHNAPCAAPAETVALLNLMTPRQRGRLEALRAGPITVGTGFRRVRTEAGRRVQRLEARFDGIAGCLRTPAGGSSRQIVLLVGEGRVRTRLMTPRESARLMGLPEDYPLPASATQALTLTGDGVAVPVVRWLGERLLAPLLSLCPGARP